MEDTPDEQVRRFRESVTRRAAGTPWIVTERPRGFDVGVTIIDAWWVKPFRVSRSKETFVHRVTVRGDATFTISNRSTRSNWGFGVPVRGVEQFVGRQFASGTVMGRPIDQRGFVNYRFDSAEGSAMIKDTARELGLTQRVSAVVWGVLIYFAVVLVVVGGGFLAHWLGWF